MPNKNIFPSQRSNGFTMIELVMVMVLAGILAIAVIPRFADKSTFDTRGFFDQSVAMLRYAQKVAIAQRTPVCVSANAATQSIFLYYAAVPVSASPCTSAAELANPVINPAENIGFLKTAPSGVTLSATVVFYFDALGRPNPNNPHTITITGDGVTQTIQVEAETGYVHL